MQEHIGFLLADASRIMRKRFDVVAKNVGVTGPQWRVLANVARTPGINQGQLSDRLEVEPITTCRMIDRLEQAGLVERRRDPMDRRAWQIFNTAAATPLIETLREVADEVLASATSGFTDDERDQFRTLMSRMRINLLEDSLFVLKEVRHG
jgi:DNA-binding MarR family transcriptional regulator